MMSGEIKVGDRVQVVGWSSYWDGKTGTVVREAGRRWEIQGDDRGTFYMTPRCLEIIDRPSTLEERVAKEALLWGIDETDPIRAFEGITARIERQQEELGRVYDLLHDALRTMEREW